MSSRTPSINRSVFLRLPCRALGLVAIAGISSISQAAGEAQKLSAKEMSAFIDQVQRCWHIPVDVVGVKGARVSLRMELDPTGALKAEPTVVSGEIDGLLALSAIRAVKRCSPFSMPSKDYEAWKVIIVNFGPIEAL